jgi:uncharacterized protein (DUF983 family)
MFGAYLKLNPVCTACGADFSRSETADVAPYVTVFIVGLILTPALLVVTMGLGWRSDRTLGLVLVGAVGLTLLLLPRVKGVLSALLWRAGREM